MGLTPSQGGLGSEVCCRGCILARDGNNLSDRIKEQLSSVALFVAFFVPGARLRPFQGFPIEPEISESRGRALEKMEMGANDS